MSENPIDDAKNYLRQALGALMEIEDGEKRSVKRVKEDFMAMLESLPSDDRRKDVISSLAIVFCFHCGTSQPIYGTCQCWNDE
jgi:hypothetical protein